MNARWHASHPMPRPATLDDRVKWHAAHAKHCRCRPIPATIREEIERRASRKPSRPRA